MALKSAGGRDRDHPGAASIEMNMFVVMIFGMYLLFPWPRASIVSAPPMAVWQSPQAQESQPGNSSPATEPATDQQKSPDASAPKSPVASSPPCQNKSQPGSSVKSDCK